MFCLCKTGLAFQGSTMFVKYSQFFNPIHFIQKSYDDLISIGRLYCSPCYTSQIWEYFILTDINHSPSSLILQNSSFMYGEYYYPTVSCYNLFQMSNELRYWRHLSWFLGVLDVWQNYDYSLITAALYQLPIVPVYVPHVLSNATVLSSDYIDRIRWWTDCLSVVWCSFHVKHQMVYTGMNAATQICFLASRC